MTYCNICDGITTRKLNETAYIDGSIHGSESFWCPFCSHFESGRIYPIKLGTMKGTFHELIEKRGVR